MSAQTDDYYVFCGRLVRFLREADKIVALFNRLGEKLIVMGDGPDAAYIKSIAGDTITFV